MKKTWGVLVVAICLLVAGILGHGSLFTQKNNSSPKEVSASSFSGMYNQFRLFGDSLGIFILKEDREFDVNDFFIGSVVLTPMSGQDDTTGRAYTDFWEIEWKYEAVVIDSNGNWRTTEIIRLNVGYGQRNVTYWLPRAAVAGDYGIRVTAYVGGEKLHDRRDRLVSGIYLIKYAEELSYMYCVDHTGQTSYDVVAPGGGLGRTISVAVVVNPGAVRTDDMIQGEVHNVASGVDRFNIGNLAPEAALNASSLNFHFESAWGQPLEWWEAQPYAWVEDGMIQIYLPPWLPRGNYVLRVYHKITDEVFGTYVVRNGGVFMEKGPGIEAVIPKIFLAGVVFCVIFGVLYMVPAVAISVQNMKYRAMEQKRYRAALEISGSNLTEAEREELEKEQLQAAKESRSGKFLGKMAENRQKREIAREAGLTMEEFNELEKRLKKEQNQKEVSLSSFRKALDGKANVITQQQEAEEEASRQAEEKAKPQQRAAGTPEFDMLDSMKGNDEVEKAIAEKTKVESEVGAEKQEDDPGSGSILARLKALTGEDN